MSSQPGPTGTARACHPPATSRAGLRHRHLDQPPAGHDVGEVLAAQHVGGSDVERTPHATHDCLPERRRDVVGVHHLQPQTRRATAVPSRYPSIARFGTHGPRKYREISCPAARWNTSAGRSRAIARSGDAASTSSSTRSTEALSTLYDDDRTPSVAQPSPRGTSSGAGEYAPTLEATTTCGTPARRAASRTRRVPATFTSCSRRRSWLGWIAHASWTTASAPANAAVRVVDRTRRRRRRTPTHVATSYGAGGVPRGTRRATPTTEVTVPSSTNRRSSAVPTFPLAPTTTTLMGPRSHQLRAPASLLGARGGASRRATMRPCRSFACSSGSPRSPWWPAAPWARPRRPSTRRARSPPRWSRRRRRSGPRRWPTELLGDDRTTAAVTDTALLDQVHVLEEAADAVATFVPADATGAGWQADALDRRPGRAAGGRGRARVGQRRRLRRGVRGRGARRERRPRWTTSPPRSTR